jgi:hypothetical protein
VKRPSDRILKNLGRFGLVSRGLVYLLLALIAVEIAGGGSSSQASDQGVFEAIARQPLGRVALVAVAAGFVCMAAWQAVNAISRKGEWTQRAVAATKVLVYLSLAGSAAAVVVAIHVSSQNQQVIDFTARMMKEPGGRFLVGAVGLGVIAAGMVLLIKGIRHDANTSEIDLRSAPRRRRRLVEGVGIAGKSARAVIVAAIGSFILEAAVTFDPNHAKGIDGALRSIVQQPFGPLILGVIALGLASFGCYSLLEIPYVKA